jgi:hypothetical protein
MFWPFNKWKPKPPKMVNVGISKAHLITARDSYTITREGEVWGDLFVSTSKQLIIGYLSNARNVYQADNGDVIPIHEVRQIRLEHFVHEVPLE